jgi:predicted dehydrogenase
MSDRKMRAAFVGAGTVAEMHGRGVSANTGVELAGVFDRNGKRAAEITGKFGGRIYSSLEELLSDAGVEAVHVLTPPEHHIEIALAALNAGKHVLVEKPVAWHVEEIEALAQAARKANRVCMPAHNYIYAPSLWQMKGLMGAGRLGKITSLWILYNIFHSEEVAERYGGVLRAVCVHHAYSLLYLLGRPQSVTANLTSLHYDKLTCEDQAMIVCEMPDGTLANLWCSFAGKDLTADPWIVLYKVLGTQGGMTYSWSEARVEDDRGPGWDLPRYEHGFATEIDYFYNQCISRREAPLSTLADAADALRIIEAAELSAQKGAKQMVQYG